MKDQELLAKTHALCESLREIMQDEFDAEIYERMQRNQIDEQKVPDISFVLDRDRNDRTGDALDSFFCDIADEVHRRLCEDAKDRHPEAFLNPNNVR